MKTKSGQPPARRPARAGHEEAVPALPAAAAEEEEEAAPTVTA